jgi:hypothetical protein
MSEASLDKRKVCVFLLLVGIALVCVVLIAYMLFYARPRTDPAIQEGQHSLLEWDACPFVNSCLPLPNSPSSLS